jgi:4-hydroxybutyrate dehydrogenase
MSNSGLATFSFPTTIVFGVGAVASIPEQMKSRGMRRPLIVTDRALVSVPVFADIQRAIGHTFPVFAGVDPNPTEQNVREGVAFYQVEACDSIIAAGGGSAIDAAKAVRLAATHKRPLAEYDDLKNGGELITADIPPMLAVPTTAGTGSDVGRSTVITLESTARKTVIFSPYLIHSASISDPALTVDMPAKITAGTGMDAFTHNFEAYLAVGYHPMCDAIAMEGVRFAWTSIARVVEDPSNLSARTNMMMSAIMGATAFQKGLGAVHSLAHPLSTIGGMHHGTSNAVLLPHVTEFNAPAIPERLKVLARIMGTTDVPKAIRDLNGQLGIAPRLRDYGITEAMIEPMLVKAMEDGCRLSNPRPCGEEEMRKLYHAAL